MSRLPILGKMILMAVVVFMLSCEGDGAKKGTIALSTQSPLTTDSQGVFYQIECTTTLSDGGVPGGGGVVQVIEKFVPFHIGMAPPWLTPAEGGDEHSFADLFSYVEAPSTCEVTATVGDFDQATGVFTPNPRCETKTINVFVEEGTTVETVIVINCKGDEDGALDIPTVVNECPVITNMTIENKFFCVGSDSPIIATVIDPDGDAVTCEWSVVSWPAGAGPGDFSITPSTTTDVTGHEVVFSADVIGEYGLILDCTDIYEECSTTFEFPMYAIDCDLCCKSVNIKPPTYHIVATEEECQSQGDIIYEIEPNMELCEEVCCHYKDPFGNGEVYAFLPLGTCQVFPSHEIVSPELCKEGTHEWPLDITLNPDTGCDEKDLPMMVIPSSSDDKFVVYDLASDPPSPISATPTFIEANCNPSRMAMDYATNDAFIACRGTGTVFRFEHDAASGDFIWRTQLPDLTNPGQSCQASRSVVQFQGRLYTGCSNPPAIFELDPNTGAILQGRSISAETNSQTHSPYGMVANANGLFICDFGNQVLNFSLDDLSTLDEISVSCYGITTNCRNDIIVTTGNLMNILDTSNPSNLSISNTFNLGSFNSNGVITDLDNNIYAGGSGTAVVKIEDGTWTQTVHNLAPGDVHPRGVIATAERLVSINLTSSTLSRFMLNDMNNVVSFGDDGGTQILSGPYGYSYDATGIIERCCVNTTQHGVVTHDSGSPTTTWQQISWQSNEPPGTTVQGSYRICDAGPTNCTPWTSMAPPSPYIITSPNQGQIIEIMFELQAASGSVMMPWLGNVSVDFLP